VSRAKESSPGVHPFWPSTGQGRSVFLFVRFHLEEAASRVQRLVRPSRELSLRCAVQIP
jgi:hypothetical protein